MMKTAMQQAIDEMVKRRDSYGNIPTDGSPTAVLLREECLRSFNECIDILRDLLPKEREQIENAHKDGFADAYGVIEKRTAEQYFNQTFKQ